MQAMGPPLIYKTNVNAVGRTCSTISNVGGVDVENVEQRWLTAECRFRNRRRLGPEQ